MVDTNGQSALHLACLEGSLDCLSYLLSTKELGIVQFIIKVVLWFFHRCDINLKDKRLSNPLHLATKTNRSNIVKILVQHGANITIRDIQGKTPLHYAMQMVSI